MAVASLMAPLYQQPNLRRQHRRPAPRPSRARHSTKCPRPTDTASSNRAAGYRTDRNRPAERLALLSHTNPLCKSRSGHSGPFTAVQPQTKERTTWALLTDTFMLSILPTCVTMNTTMQLMHCAPPRSPTPPEPVSVPCYRG